MSQPTLFEKSLPEIPVPHSLRVRPKIDLHRHLLGSLTAQDVQELAAVHKLVLPTSSSAELEGLLRIRRPVRGLKEFFRPWPVLSKLLVSPAVLESLSYMALRHAHSDCVVYTEFRATWGMTGREPFGVGSFLTAVQRGFDRAHKEFGIVGRIVFGITRHLLVRHIPSHRRRLWSTILDAACEHRGAPVVGFDLSGVEAGYSADLYVNELSEARRAGFPLTIHCGEEAPASEVRAVVDHLKPERIGHGISAANDQSVLELLAASGTVVEACPTTNWLTGTVVDLADHPLKKMHECGVPITINTDNPAVCGTTLSREFAIVLELMALHSEDIVRFQGNSLKAMFADSSVRTDVGKRFEAGE